MATTPGWTPPQQTRPITPEVYALLRTYIEAATAATAAYIDNNKAGCSNYGSGQIEGVDNPQTCRNFKTKPDLADMALVFFEFVPLESLSFDQATTLARNVMGYKPDHVFELWELPGWPTWVDKDQLIAALDKATPEEVRAQLPLDGPPDKEGKLLELPDALTGGLEWWTIALGAVGVLAFLGRRTLVGMAISLIPKTALQSVARMLFKALVLAGILTAITYLGKKAVENATSAVSSVLPYIAAGGAVLVGVAVWMWSRSNRRRYAEV